LLEAARERQADRLEPGDLGVVLGELRGETLSGRRWHSPQSPTSRSGATSSGPRGILRASPPSPRRAASPCPRPGPWQRSQETFGTRVAGSTVRAPCVEVIVAWQFTHLSSELSSRLRPCGPTSGRWLAESALPWPGVTSSFGPLAKYDSRCS